MIIRHTLPILLFLFGLTISSKAQDTLVIAGIGDVMLGTNYPSKKYLPPNDSNMMILAAMDLIKPDVTFANLEGTILTEGGHAKQCKDPSKCYVFRMPERYSGYIVECGIDAVSLANNHSGDMGTAGRQKTQYWCEMLGIASAGHLNQPYALFTKDSITYGLCAFSPNNGTCRINDYAGAKVILAELDTLCDVIIASFHGGAEGPKHLHVTRATERYYGENRGNVYEFAHMLVDHGADVVFGHGPHVVRAVDIYKERLICYSLGNFCTYARFNLTGKRGNAPIVEAHIKPTGELIFGKIISYLQEGEGGPFPDPENSALKEIKRLTEEDLPEVKITFEENGIFRIQEEEQDLPVDDNR